MPRHLSRGHREIEAVFLARNRTAIGGGVGAVGIVGQIEVQGADMLRVVRFFEIDVSANIVRRNRGAVGLEPVNHGAAASLLATGPRNLGLRSRHPLPDGERT